MVEKKKKKKTMSSHQINFSRRKKGFHSKTEKAQNVTFESNRRVIKSNTIALQALSELGQI